MNRKALSLIGRRVAGLNRVRDGLVYVQVTRGEAPRDHKFPTKPVPPALVVTARHLPVPKDLSEARMIDVITGPDERWARPDIKSISLLPNVLAKQAAAEAGAYETWMINAQGEVTEGSSANAWMVSRDADSGRVVLRTPPTGTFSTVLCERRWSPWPGSTSGRSRNGPSRSTSCSRPMKPSRRLRAT